MSENFEKQSEEIFDRINNSVENGEKEEILGFLRNTLAYFENISVDGEVKNVN